LTASNQVLRQGEDALMQLRHSLLESLDVRQLEAVRSQPQVLVEIVPSRLTSC
jgi:hypothetical protein